VSDSTYLEADEERLIPNIRNGCDVIPKVDKAVLDHGWRPGAQWTTMHLIKVYNSRLTLRYGIHKVGSQSSVVAETPPVMSVNEPRFMPHHLICDLDRGAYLTLQYSTLPYLDSRNPPVYLK